MWHGGAAGSHTLCIVLWAAVCYSVDCILHVCLCVRFRLGSKVLHDRGLLFWDRQYVMVFNRRFEMPTPSSHTDSTLKMMWEAAYWRWGRAVQSLVA